jgi:putative transposase
MRKILNGIHSWIPGAKPQKPKKEKLTKAERKRRKLAKREEERLAREERRRNNPPKPRNKEREQETMDRLDERSIAYFRPLLAELFPERKRGRKQADLINILNGIMYQARTGCQWRLLPREFGNYTTVHKWLTKFKEVDLFRRFWELMIRECEEVNAVDWQWLAVDGSLGKSKRGNEDSGPNPTDRGKGGVKRSLMVEGNGYPIGLVISAANIHDTNLLADTLKVAFKPTRPQSFISRLLLDKGYANPTGRDAVKPYKYRIHLKTIGEEGLISRYIAGDDGIPRRWKNERAHSWMNSYRAVKERRAAKTSNYEAVCEFVCGLLWYRRLYQAQNWIDVDRAA